MNYSKTRPLCYHQLHCEYQDDWLYSKRYGPLLITLEHTGLILSLPLCEHIASLPAALYKYNLQFTFINPTS